MLVVLVGSTALASRCSQYSSAAQCADASECAWCVGANASGSCATNGTAAAADRVQSVAPLSVSGTSLVFNGAPVFLSGANLAQIARVLHIPGSTLLEAVDRVRERAIGMLGS